MPTFNVRIRDIGGQLEPIEVEAATHGDAVQTEQVQDMLGGDEGTVVMEITAL